MSIVLHVDCIQGMRSYLADNSVDSIVTDPPYELGFMGKGWDASGIANNVEMWREALRVLKPGGHLLAFSGSRTYHRMVCAIEDAGFEIRDQIMWVYGSGFPKSLDVSKAIDKTAGAERELTRAGTVQRDGYGDDWDTGSSSSRPRHDTPVTDAARRWQGWGTALKPAHEPIVVARKPLIGTVAANVLAHGTGALNIDGCQVGTAGGLTTAGRDARAESQTGAIGSYASSPPVEGRGRWPANLIHDGSDEVIAAFPMTAAGSFPAARGVGGISTSRHAGQTGLTARRSDAGSAARFFYCAKASKSDRGEGNTHPTVKPNALCRYLQRLVTPPGGLTVDIFAGSGSFGVSAKQEGFLYMGFDLDAGHVEIANRRIGATT